MVGPSPVNPQELNQLKQEMELLKTMVGSLKLHNEYLEQENNALKEAVKNAEGAATNAQNTANDAVNRANNAQNTANTALTSSVKEVKFFTAVAAKDTTSQQNNLVIAFPERIDAVVLESVQNDANQIWKATISRTSDTTFNLNLIGIHGNGHRWIPSLRYTGIQVRR